MKKNIFFVFLFIILYSSFFIHPAYAVTETSGDLQVTYDKPMFPDTTVWYPGLTIAKSFSVKNIGGGTHTASLKAGNTFQTGNLADNLYFRLDEGTTNRYGGANDKTIKNFWDIGETNLSDIGSGSTTSYTLTISMPGTLGNEFQGTKAKFNLIVGFVGTESKVTVSDGGTVAGKPTGAVVTTLAHPGFAPGVLGVATSKESLAVTPSATITQTGQVEGIQTSLLNKKLIFGFAGLLGGIFLFLFYLRNNWTK